MLCQGLLQGKLILSIFIPCYYLFTITRNQDIKNLLLKSLTLLFCKNFLDSVFKWQGVEYVFVKCTFISRLEEDSHDFLALFKIYYCGKTMTRI